MLFPSSEWLDRWIELCNADESFRAAGAGWDGAAGCVVRADRALHTQAVYLRLDGRDGQWTGHALGPDPASVDGTVFVLSADYATWRGVILQELHPIRAMVMGKVRVKGQLSQVLRWTRPLVTMTELAGRIDTDFVEPPSVT